MNNVTRQMPIVKPRDYVPMRAALDVLFDARRCGDVFEGSAQIYFDYKRCIHYRSRWTLKTQKGAFERQRRETIQYLTDLRNQIDEVLAKLETAQPDEQFGVQVLSSAYDKE